MAEWSKALVPIAGTTKVWGWVLVRTWYISLSMEWKFAVIKLQKLGLSEYNLCMFGTDKIAIAKSQKIKLLEHKSRMLGIVKICN